MNWAVIVPVAEFHSLLHQPLQLYTAVKAFLQQLFDCGGVERIVLQHLPCSHAWNSNPWDEIHWSIIICIWIPLV